MGNLTETEVLYHRHLTLLKALEKAGVRVDAKLGDAWEVRVALPPTPVAPLMRPDDSVSIGYSNGLVSAGYVDVQGRHQAVGWTAITPGQSRLLAALVAAIVPPSPAKVD